MLNILVFGLMMITVSGFPPKHLYTCISTTGEIEMLMLDLAPIYTEQLKHEKAVEKLHPQSAIPNVSPVVMGMVQEFKAKFGGLSYSRVGRRLNE